MKRIEKIVLIGSGNVAEALAIAIGECETLELTQIYGRNELRVKHIADLAGCKNYTTDPQQLSAAELYIIAVSDSAIPFLAESLPYAEGSIVAHSAGSVSLTALEATGRNHGVFYPMQTFSRGRRVNFGEVPLFIEGDSRETTEALMCVAKELSSNVVELSTERRGSLHLAAAFACNFTNAMMTAAAEVLSSAEIDLALYEPLMRETIAKAMEAQPTPRAAQTGAAVRGDKTTMERHLSELEHIEDAAERENLKEIYKIISKYIWETSKRI